MRAVLLSVRPEWCRKIAKGEKTVEVRKTAPKLPMPYKVYLYCTKQRTKRDAFNIPISRAEMLRDMQKNGMKCMSRYANGKVWGEFMCDADLPLLFACSDPAALTTHYEVPGTCLTDVEIMEYLGNGKEGHGLHISELKIYDRPRELSVFRRVYANGLHCELSRPPQSWCYVEADL